MCVFIIPIYIQQDATLHSLLHLKTALHVSGGTSTHHQERIQLYLQHLVFVTRLLLPAAIAAGSSNNVTNTRNIYFSSVGNLTSLFSHCTVLNTVSHGYCYLPLLRRVVVTLWQIPDAVDTVVCAPDDGWRYHPKHVEQFPDTIKMCNVTSCWIYIGIIKTHIIIFNTF